jgi:hypothetical protein
MEDDLGAGDRPRNRFGVAQVRLDEIDPVLDLVRG